MKFIKNGKSFDNKVVLRTPEWISEQIENAKNKAKYFSKYKRKIIKICPMCDSDNHKDFVKIYNFTYKECQNCHNLFLADPIEDLMLLYTNDGSESSYECYLSDEIYNRRLKLIARPKVNFIHNIAKRSCKSKLWLDIGSGGGENLYAAKKLGYDILGFESDEKAVNFSNDKLKGNKVKKGFLDINNCDENLLKAIKKASIITFFNVLEHLEYPKKTIHFFRRHMKKNSLLVIEVPRHPSLASYANFLAPDKVYRHCIAPFHLNIFSEKSIILASSVDRCQGDSNIDSGGGGFYNNR
ncbi:class I SAM-dependent methyltransferase [Campylobacter jejuni]|nr:class I SAM-dependent methyltransferase [Campylobacter jejuni]